MTWSFDMDGKKFCLVSYIVLLYFHLCLQMHISRSPKSWISQDTRIPNNAGGFRIAFAKMSNSSWKQWLAGARITVVAFWVLAKNKNYVCLCVTIYPICHQTGCWITGFLFLCLCDYTDYCLPAIWEVCGLVGIRSAALWDVGWPGKSYPPVLAMTSSCLSNAALYQKLLKG